MRKRLFWWEAGGFLFVGGLGTLLHFLYEWSGEHLLAAVVSAVNESTWEHMKLLFVPVFLFTVAQVCVLARNHPNLLAVRAVSSMVGLLLIPVLYYTYTGIWGRSVSWINIAIFFLAALVLFWVDFRLLRKGRFTAPWQQVAGLILLWAWMFCFVWCTFRTPHIALWQDPVTGQFGI